MGIHRAVLPVNQSGRQRPLGRLAFRFLAAGERGFRRYRPYAVRGGLAGGGGRAQALEQAGAQGIILCTNTMHKVADQIAQRCPLPLLHIADATAECLHRAGVRRVGLLGTRFTMEEAFYRDRLSAPHGLEVVVPDSAERQRVHDIIFNELCLGILRDDSRRAFNQIIAGLQFEGVDAIVLGCTEIGLLLSQDQVSVPLFDTTEIHATAAVDFALG